MRKLSPNTFAKLYAQHQKWLGDPTVGKPLELHDVSLSDINFRSFPDLRHSIFYNCNLNHTELRSVDLHNAAFIGGEFRFTYFMYSNLSQAALTGADLTCSMFNDSNLTGAVLRDSNLTAASFHRSNLADIDLANADIHHLVYDTNRLIIAGQDPRGYLFYATPWSDGTGIIIKAGCRRFTSIEDAQAHWHDRHAANVPLQRIINHYLQLIEAHATGIGWLP